MAIRVLAVDRAPLPAPTRATAELGDSADVEAWGLDLSLEDARFVAMILSWFLAQGNSKNRPQIYDAMLFLSLACGLVVERDGEVWEPPHPDLLGRSWPHAETGMGHLGIDRDDLAAYWRAARTRAVDACYPPAWLMTIFPAPFWSAVATLVRWGPARALASFEEAVLVSARTPIARATRRRAAGSFIAGTTIDTRVSAVWALMQAIVDVRARIAGSANPPVDLMPLDPWVSKPKRPKLEEFGVVSSGLDNTGPTLEQCQQALKELARDYKRHPKAPTRRLRRLILHSLCSLLGPRADALRTALIEDYLPNRSWPDGCAHPTLRLFPGKTRAADQAHFLPLPAEVAQWLEAWILLTGREIGQTGQPLFPGRPDRDGNPNFLAAGSFYVAIAGKNTANGRQRALVPLGDDPYLGVRPHGFRHASNDLARRAAANLKAANPGVYDHYTPEDFSRALLAQQLVRSVNDTYRDLNADRLTVPLVAEAWRILWGDGPARTGLDPAAIEEAHARCIALSGAIAVIEVEMARFEGELAGLASKAKRLDGDAASRAVVESNALAAMLSERSRKLRALSLEQVEAERALDHARTTSVELHDSLSDDEHRRQLERALNALEVTTSVVPDVPLLDELQPKQVARLFGVSEQAINAWSRNGPPKNRPLPWTPDAWIIDGPRKKRLPVSGLNTASFSPEQLALLDEIRRGR